MPKRARASTYGSGGKKKARTRRRCVYRKRSAFKRRKSFSAKRAPVTECKKKEVEPEPSASAVNGSNTEYPQGTLMPIYEGPTSGSFISIPATWAKMKRGFNEDEMTGRDIFLKWLHVKRRLSWNTTKMTQWNYRIRCRCVHGWVMLPGCTPEAGENTDHMAEVANILKEEFSKVLAGPDKTKVRILSDRMVTRDPNFALQADGKTLAPRRSFDLHYKWAPMRKIRYDQPEKDDATNSIFLPEPSAGLWIPFHFEWDQSNAEAPVLGTAPKVKPQDFVHALTREEMYFTDS